MKTNDDNLTMSDRHFATLAAMADARTTAVQHAGEAWTFPQAKAVPNSAMAARVAELEAEGAALRGLIADAQGALAAHLPPDGPSEHDTLQDLYGLLDRPRSRVAMAISKIGGAA